MNDPIGSAVAGVGVGPLLTAGVGVFGNVELDRIPSFRRSDDRVLGRELTEIDPRSIVAQFADRRDVLLGPDRGRQSCGCFRAPPRNQNRGYRQCVH